MAKPECTSPVIGLTSTIPVEIVFAAGLVPIDLNNLFISTMKPEELLTQAESAGFSHNVCAWIKGIYSVVINHHIQKVIAVTGGDCSNTIALAEILARRGIEIIPFDYPPDRSHAKNNKTIWLDTFLKAIIDGEAIGGYIRLYNLPKDGDPYDHLKVTIDTQSGELKIEITDSTRPERRQTLASRIVEEVRKLKGVRQVMPSS